MDHFYNIRSLTTSGRLRKRLLGPIIPLIRRQGRIRIEDEPGYELLSPYLLENKIEVVVSARRFFRLIDFDNRVVINIFKKKDLINYFDNEISARKNLAGRDFIPRLIEVDSRRKVFIEEYVCQRPFKSGSLSDMNPVKVLGRIKQILAEIHGSSPVQLVSTGDYVGELAAKIISRPEAGEEIVRYVESLRDKALGLEGVELVFSHGDFRKDQIFFAADGSLKIIDWECSGRFSRYFDIMELYHTEKWFYKNPTLNLENILNLDRDRLEKFCAIFLLELCSFPIRFKREFMLTRSIPVIKKVERRLRQYAFGGRKN